MVKGVTRSGFQFEISEDAANDMELLEDLVDLDAGKLTALVPVFRRILGDQKQALYDHLRDPETGRVPMDKAQEEILDIFAAIKGGKKS